MTALELRDGWLVPSAISQKMFLQWQAEAVEHIDAVLPFLKSHRTAIQAGGNLGIWPKLLIEKYGFQRVVTFEPDETNLQCLHHNTEVLEQVRRIPSAVGDKAGRARWSRASDHKPGWHKIAPEHCAVKFVAGEVPVMTIDEIDEDAVDFLALDVEGYELPALMGAEHTIARCRPVVLFEDLGNSQSEAFRKKSGRAYGFDAGSVQQWLAERGYRKVAAIQNDEVWAFSG